MKKLSLSRILLYSSASAGLNIMGITVGTWLLYFYSPPLDSGRPIYLPVTVVGLLMTLTSLWDAFIDPFIGHWSDMRRGRLGRRRPFLLFAAPLAALALIFIWTPPSEGSHLLNGLYFFLLVTFFYTALSLVGIPYDGSMPEMAQSPRDLVNLSTWKNIIGLSGVMVGALVAAPLFDTIGPLAMGIVVAAVGLLTVWLTLAGLRETERLLGQPLPVWQGLRATLENRQFHFMLASVLFIHIAYAITSTNLPYFVTLVIGQSEGQVGTYMGVIVASMLLFAPFWNWISRRISGRKILLICMLGLALVLSINAGVGLLPGLEVQMQALVVAGLVGPFLGGYFILAYAMMGNVVDYDEMLTHSRREAIYYGAFSLAASIGPSLAALVLPFILETFGYTRLNPLGVRLAWLAASLCALLGALTFWGYRLGDTPDETRRNLGMEVDS